MLIYRLTEFAAKSLLENPPESAADYSPNKHPKGFELSDEAKIYACCAYVNKREWRDALNQVPGDLGHSYESISLSIIHYLFWASAASMLLRSSFQRPFHPVNKNPLPSLFLLPSSVNFPAFATCTNWHINLLAATILGGCPTLLTARVWALKCDRHFG